MAMIRCFLFLGFACPVLAAANPYPPAGAREVSPGNTIYHIDPVHGDDSAAGTRADAPWRTFRKLNQIELAAGDRVEVMRPGPLEQTLALTGTGTGEQPIRIRFAPGRYDFHPAAAYREAWQISNTNSDPEGLKAVAIHIKDASHLEIVGRAAVIFQRGKAIHVCIERSEHITVEGMAFDYHRPTVSEFTVTAAGSDFADFAIHPDSAYAIEDGGLAWLGEGWRETGGLAQNLDLETGRVFRQARLFDGLRFEEIGANHVRAHGTHRFVVGRIYQVRNPFRDCVGVFTQHSRDISWRDVHFRFIHGMGMINQFSENLTFDGIVFAPPVGSGRTTSAFADCIQASGCRGKVIVHNCVFQGAHDDAINIHGTHLRVVAHNPETRHVMARFMHDQTFGFEAFLAGDEIEFVRHDTLETYGPNRILEATLIDPKNMRLKLANPMPEDIGENDVLENVTWAPEVDIRGCTVRHIPTRGFLITTRRPVVVEDNDFFATHMPGILIECDARGWFESGVVRDMRIRGNRFYDCGRAAIHIHPQNNQPNPAVHRNIRIENNLIIPREGAAAVIASSTSGLHITGNTIKGDAARHEADWLRIKNCEEVVISENVIVPVWD
ncbi:MAG: right-handed parallel beta-helix repeat-containing protein [Luteolibacter sp.]